MSGVEMPPHIAASIDRHRAVLRELAAAARHHVDAMACEHPAACVGGQVLHVIDRTSRSALANLMALAVAELAVLGYGLDVDHPARALLAGLETPEGDDDGRG